MQLELVHLVGEDATEKQRLVGHRQEAGIARHGDHRRGFGHWIDAHDEDDVSEDGAPARVGIGAEQEDIDALGAVPSVLGRVHGLLGLGDRAARGRVRRRRAVDHGPAEDLAQRVVELGDHEADPGVHRDGGHDQDRHRGQADSALARLDAGWRKPGVRDGERAPAEERHVRGDHGDEEGAGEEAVPNVPDAVDRRRDARDEEQDRNREQHGHPALAGVGLTEPGEHEGEQCRQPGPRVSRTGRRTVRCIGHGRPSSVSPHPFDAFRCVLSTRGGYGWVSTFAPSSRRPPYCWLRNLPGESFAGTRGNEGYVPPELAIVALTALLVGLLLMGAMLAGRRAPGDEMTADVAAERAIAALSSRASPSTTAGSREPRGPESTLRVAWWLTVTIVLLGVGLSGSFVADQRSIFVLGGAAVATVVVLHEVLGKAERGRLLHVVEVVAAVGLIGGLLALTGFASSPFAMLFALVSVAAALAYGPQAGLAAAGLATAAFAAVLLLDPQLASYAPRMGSASRSAWAPRGCSPSSRSRMPGISAARSPTRWPCRAPIR